MKSPVLTGTIIYPAAGSDYSPSALRLAAPRALPSFEIVAMGELVEHSRILAQWTVGDARFFVWLDAAGTVIGPDAFIHKNSVAPEWIGKGSTRRKNPEAFPHRTVSQYAKAHTHIVAAIRDAIADGALARAAVAAYIAADAAADAEADAAYAERLRDAMLAECAILAGDNQYPAESNLRRAAHQLTDDQLIRLAGALQGARK